MRLNMRQMLSVGAFAIAVMFFAGIDVADVGRGWAKCRVVDQHRWISWGLRRSRRTPFLQGLMEHGLYTRELVPVFPSLTFPSHMSEATGVLPGVHGIVSNKYLDTITGTEFNLSTLPQALRAEPIWMTATRQGRRTASSIGRSPRAGATAGGRGADRLFLSIRHEALGSRPAELLVSKYRADFASPQADEPLRLLMGYAYGTDKAGHRSGPTSPAVDAAIGEMDRLLADIVGQVAGIFHEHMHPAAGDALWVLFTTDHG